MVPEAIYTAAVLARYWAKVDKSGECWTWTAATTSFGYGVFHPVKGRTIGAHRYSLSLKLGRELTPGAFACHTCDNPGCVNPSHLYEGTPQSNVADAVSRGRNKRGDMGDGVKLSDMEVIAIRERAAKGEMNRALAAEYGVQESLISMVTRGQRWAHVGGPISTKYNKRKAA